MLRKIKRIRKIGVVERADLPLVENHHAGAVEPAAMQNKTAADDKPRIG